MLMISGGAMYGLTTSEAFVLDPGALRVEGLGYTDAALARSLIGLDAQPRPNAFRVRTTELEAALAALPPVRTARVEVQLPDRLHVTIEERTPIMTWHRGTRPSSWTSRAGRSHRGTALMAQDPPSSTCAPPSLQ